LDISTVVGERQRTASNRVLRMRMPKVFQQSGISTARELAAEVEAVAGEQRERAVMAETVDVDLEGDQLRERECEEKEAKNDAIPAPVLSGAAAVANDEELVARRGSEEAPFYSPSNSYAALDPLEALATNADVMDEGFPIDTDDKSNGSGSGSEFCKAPSSLYDPEMLDLKFEHRMEIKIADFERLLQRDDTVRIEGEWSKAPDGTEWRFLVFPIGLIHDIDVKGKYLSVFLEMKESDEVKKKFGGQNWSRKVRYCIELVRVREPSGVQVEKSVSRKRRREKILADEDGTDDEDAVIVEANDKAARDSEMPMPPVNEKSRVDLLSKNARPAYDTINWDSDRPEKVARSDPGKSDVGTTIANSQGTNLDTKIEEEGQENCDPKGDEEKKINKKSGVLGERGVLQPPPPPLRTESNGSTDADSNASAPPPPPPTYGTTTSNPPSPTAAPSVAGSNDPAAELNIRIMTDTFQHQIKDWGFKMMMTLNRISRGFLDEDGSITLRAVLIPFIDLSRYDSKKETGMVGLENHGATCYLNSLIQTLFMTKKLRRALYELDTTNDEAGKGIALELQRLFWTLQTSSRPAATRQLTQAFGWTNHALFRQHDVQEMNRELIDKLENRMKGTAHENLMRELYIGKMRSFVRCVNVPFESSRDEEFYDIQLDVKNMRSVHQAFEKYIETERLDGDNQYEAEGHGKQDADKGVTFLSFPPVLNLHLKRFEFDIYTELTVKINDEFNFPQRLKLDKYLDPSVQRQREENGDEKYEYILHSVLVHLGDVNSGHYYAFINDIKVEEPAVEGEKPKLRSYWFKFDDEKVTPSSVKHAVFKNFGNRASHARYSTLGNAYMLVYVQVSRVPDILCKVPDSIVSDKLLERFKRDEELQREREEKERAERNSVTISYVTFEQAKNLTTLSHLILRGGRQRDHVDFARLPECPSVKLHKTDSVLKLHETLAEEVGVSDLSHMRLWNIISRKNHTQRPGEAISRHVEEDVGRVFENDKKPTVFIETLEDFIGKDAVQSLNGGLEEEKEKADDSIQKKKNDDEDDEDRFLGANSSRSCDDDDDDNDFRSRPQFSRFEENGPPLKKRRTYEYGSSFGPSRREIPLASPFPRISKSISGRADPSKRLVFFKQFHPERQPLTKKLVLLGFDYLEPSMVPEDIVRVHIVKLLRRAGVAHPPTDPSHYKVWEAVHPRSFSCWSDKYIGSGFVSSRGYVNENKFLDHIEIVSGDIMVFQVDPPKSTSLAGDLVADDDLEKTGDEDSVRNGTSQLLLDRNDEEDDDESGDESLNDVKEEEYEDLDVEEKEKSGDEVRHEKDGALVVISRKKKRFMNSKLEWRSSSFIRKWELDLIEPEPYRNLGPLHNRPDVAAYYNADSFCKYLDMRVPISLLEYSSRDINTRIRIDTTAATNMEPFRKSVAKVLRTFGKVDAGREDHVRLYTCDRCVSDLGHVDDLKPIEIMDEGTMLRIVNSSGANLQRALRYAPKVGGQIELVLFYEVLVGPFNQASNILEVNYLENEYPGYKKTMILCEEAEGFLGLQDRLIESMKPSEGPTVSHARWLLVSNGTIKKVFGPNDTDDPLHALPNLDLVRTNDRDVLVADIVRSSEEHSERDAAQVRLSLNYSSSRRYSEDSRSCRLVGVCHFTSATPSQRCRAKRFCLPFTLVLEKGDKPADIRRKVNARLKLDEEVTKTWRLAVMKEIRPAEWYWLDDEEEYVTDHTEIIASLASTIPHIGLFHADTFKKTLPTKKSVSGGVFSSFFDEASPLIQNVD